MILAFILLAPAIIFYFVAMVVLIVNFLSLLSPDEPEEPVRPKEEDKAERILKGLINHCVHGHPLPPID